MLSKSFYVFGLVFALHAVCTATYHRRKHSNIDISKYNETYYNPETGVALKSVVEDASRNPLAAKIAFRGLPCHCENLVCSCCTGVNLTALNINRRACMRFTYDASDIAIKMVLYMNEREVYSNSISAKNPPPFCIPFAYVPIVNFCVRFFDIYTIQKNLHTCIDFETRIIGQPILILHFNCVKLGTDGISWMKPEDSAAGLAAAKPPISEPEVYDEVDFEQQDLEVYVNYTSTLRPEDEAQIGQLKL